MKVFDVNINDIQPYKNNPRINDDAIDAVAASIQNFGWKQPIVIDKNNIIVAGHTRYKAAQKLGIETIPCIIADDLTDEEIKAYRLADNKSSELADWNFELLDDELDEILGIDMEKFGFLNDPDFIGLLDDCAEKGFMEGKARSELEEFSLTFVFPAGKKQAIEKLIKIEGKKYISEMIIKEAEKNA